MAETLKSNPYAYAGNNPVSFVDPDRRNPLLAILVGAAAIILFSMLFQVASDAATGKIKNVNDFSRSLYKGIIYGGLTIFAAVLAGPGSFVGASLAVTLLLGIGVTNLIDIGSNYW